MPEQKPEVALTPRLLLLLRNLLHTQAASLFKTVTIPDRSMLPLNFLCGLGWFSAFSAKCTWSPSSLTTLSCADRKASSSMPD